MIKTKKVKILIGPSSFGALDDAPIQKLREAGFEVIGNPYKRKLKKEEVLKLLPEVEGLIAGLEPLDQEVLERSQLKVISRCGSGMSNVDLGAAKRLGIIVKNTPLAPVTAVAELVIGCLLSLLRGIFQVNLALHHGKWHKSIGRELQGMTIAVIGFGNIGRRVSELLTAFGAKVVIVDPAGTGKANNYPLLNLEQALKQADIITIHASGEQCLLGSREFKLLRDGVYLLNAARGGLIDEVALTDALNSGKVAGAWLDTFGQEPYQGPLCEFEQVILTPHIGSYTLECRRNMEVEAVENLLTGLKEGK